MEIRSILKEGAYRSITALIGDAENMVTLPILRGPAKGLRMRADIVRRKEAYFMGKYDGYILRQLMPVVKPGWTVWDCGAYIGFYTLFFSRQVGTTGRVVAIEPDYRNLKRTKENVELNRFSNVEFVNAAVGAAAGEVEFILNDRTNSHLPGNYVGELAMKAVWRANDESQARGRVECISLDQGLIEKQLPQPQLIKIDIEGAEKDALGHAAQMFQEVRPLLLIELHNPECDRAAWRFSRRFGYELRSLNYEGTIFTADEQVRGTILCTPGERINQPVNVLSGSGHGKATSSS